jgi:hypothetical protein
MHDGTFCVQAEKKLVEALNEVPVITPKFHFSSCDPFGALATGGVDTL